MKINAYLFIDQWGGLRLTKRDSAVKPTELAVRLSIDVPDSFFRRPIPTVNIGIPDNFVNLDAATVADIVAPEIAAAMKLDVKAVEDGLVAMFRERDDAEKAKDKRRR